MSDDDDELAALRRERNRRLGASKGVCEQVDFDIVQGQGEGTDKEKETKEDASLRAMFPASFGGGGLQVDSEDGKKPVDVWNGREEENEEVWKGAVVDEGPDDFIGPSMPVEDTAAAAEEEDDDWGIPVSSEVALESHGKAVISLDVDHSGSRVITGSTDYTVKIFDFNGMRSDCKSFKTIEPSEGHPVLSLSWSPTGDAFLVVTGSSQPKIYTRDGIEEGEFARGDMYIRDLKNTKGHITSCTDGQWHPLEKGCGVTSSADGTIRVWDMWTMKQNTVIKPTLRVPGRVSVTCVRYSYDGKIVAGGLEDGAIQLWDVRGRIGHKASTGVVAASTFQALGKQNWTFVSKAGQVVRGAHERGSDITCLRFARNNFSMISRSSDSSLKLWDLRKFQSPVAAVDGLETSIGNTQCCFSPNEDLVLTGVGATKQSDGCLAFYDAQSLSLVKRLGAPGSVVPVVWHKSLNQILFGCGDRKSGAGRILYDTGLSHHGALLAVGRRPRQANTADFTVNIKQEIFNPNALPLFREEIGKKRTSSSASEKMAKMFKPDQGQAGVSRGYGGKLGASTGSLLTQHIMKNKGELKNPAREDVRASILRHAGKEDEFQRWTDAYAATQPTKIFAEDDQDEEEDEEQRQDVT